MEMEMEYEFRPIVGRVKTTKIEVVSLAKRIFKREIETFEELSAEERDRCLMILVVRSKNVMGPLGKKSESLVTLNDGEFSTTLVDKPFYKLASNSRWIHKFVVESEKNPFNVEISSDFHISLRRKINGESKFAKFSHPSWNRENLLKSIKIDNGYHFEFDSSRSYDLSEEIVDEAIKRIGESMENENKSIEEITESFISLVLSIFLKKELKNILLVDPEGRKIAIDLYEWERGKKVLTNSDYFLNGVVKKGGFGIFIPKINGSTLLPIEENIERENLSKFIKEILLEHIESEKEKIISKNQLHTQPKVVDKIGTIVFADRSFSVTNLIRSIVWFKNI